jgi:hypothetical protein
MAVVIEFFPIQSRRGHRVSDAKEPVEVLGSSIALEGFHGRCNGRLNGADKAEHQLDYLCIGQSLSVQGPPSKEIYRVADRGN